MHFLLPPLDGLVYVPGTILLWRSEDKRLIAHFRRSLRPSLSQFQLVWDSRFLLVLAGPLAAYPVANAAEGFCGPRPLPGLPPRRPYDSSAPPSIAWPAVCLSLCLPIRYVCTSCASCPRRCLLPRLQYIKVWNGSASGEDIKNFTIFYFSSVCLGSECFYCLPYHTCRR